MAGVDVGTCAQIGATPRAARDPMDFLCKCAHPVGLAATSLSFVDAKMGDRIHFYADADRWLLVLVSEPSSSEWSPPSSLCVHYPTGNGCSSAKISMRMPTLAYSFYKLIRDLFLPQRGAPRLLLAIY